MTWWEPGAPHERGAWRWELRGDEVADIRYRGRLLLRSVRAVSRDADWGTRELRVEGVQESPAGLRLEVSVHDDDGSPLLVGAVSVEAGGRRLAVAVDLLAEADVVTTRTGLVVLHPPHLAGEPLHVAHPGGDVEATAFPRAVSPHQPAFDIAGFAWRDGDVEAEVRFEGDVFEMEDQRNWTDASFKTYNRPLSMPFPHLVAAGERVVQRVEVRAAVPADVPASGGDRGGAGRDAVVVLRDGGRFPDLALGASTAPDPAPPALPQIGAAVLVELELGSPAWQEALDRAAAGGAPLDVRVVLDHGDRRHLAALDAVVRASAGLDVVRIGAFDATTHVTDRPTAAALRAALETAGRETPVVGGARSHFTQLNRERADLPDDLAGVTFSTTPLFHAVSTEQLVESVAVQRTVAQQAVAIAGDAPVHVGPVTLKPRFNDVATTAPAPGPTAPASDPRQSAPELAAWTVASAAALAVRGVASLTYFEQWGPRGVVTAGGAELPAAAALRALDALRGTDLLTGESPDGLLWALGGTTPEATTVLTANLSAALRHVTVETPHGRLAVQLPAGSWTRTDLPA